MMFAASRSPTIARSSRGERRARKLPAMPCPVTRPLRALISCIAAISGKQSSTTQHIA
ncbi:hypothetical protein GGD83_002552 [Rhodoblastus sphagnicola]|nr:hypothetical protein [Rhodoblastus sphagnicola]